ncbi:MAG: glycosyltransferase [Christensenellales bacterium]
MKIGLFTDTFYPEINGVATSCLNLQRELTRRGHEVHVYAPKCKGWEETTGKRALSGARRRCSDAPLTPLTRVRR